MSHSKFYVSAKIKGCTFGGSSCHEDAHVLHVVGCSGSQRYSWDRIIADDRWSKAYADDMELPPAVGQLSERA